MKETTKISLRNHAMSDQSKQDNTVSKSRSNGVLCGIEQAGKDYNDDMDRQFEKIKHKIKPISERERERLLDKSCGD